MIQGQETATSAVRGASRLAFDAVTELTRIVEGMHANIAAAPPPFGEGTDGRTRGVTGFVYRSIRLVADATGLGADRLLALLDRTPVGQAPLPQPHWDAVLSAANGVLGDHLAERGNPLSIPMQVRRQGRRLEPGQPPGGRKVLLLVHGLCMNDRQWRRNGHDHGAELARELGYTPFYLFYNTGRHVSENGRELAALLEEFVVSSQTPIEELTILAHSMGGLVARSACHLATEQGLSWPKHLRRLVFLGTPHHGAPFERLGSWIHSAAELSPYVAPLARLGMLRSAGITDLRHGSVRDEDWRDRGRFGVSPDSRHAVSLPEGVACYAIAGTLKEGAGSALLGDGLVPLESALGRHADPTRALAFPEGHQWTGVGIGHMALLDRLEVYGVLRNWLLG